MFDKNLLSFLRDYRISKQFKKKINHIHSLVRPPAISSDQRIKYCKYWRGLISRPSHQWLEVYQYLTGSISNEYVAEDIYYTKIEPVLNFRPMSKAETCKNSYHRIYPGFKFPEALLLNENGVNYNESGEVITWTHLDSYISDLKTMSSSVIVKPTLDSGGGTGVRKFYHDGERWTNPTDGALSSDLLRQKYKQDFIIQSGLSQSDFFAQFNPSSINSLRILTYRSVADESVHLLHVLLRIGKQGSITDNQASGGISVGVKTDGRLNGYAIDKYGKKFTSSNGIEFAACAPIPGISACLDYARRFARELKYSRLLGLDLVIDPTGKIILIEVNNINNEINFFQMNNGPLFGDFTEEVVKYCLTHPRSYCFDYTL